MAAARRGSDPTAGAGAQPECHRAEADAVRPESRRTAARVAARAAALASGRRLMGRRALDERGQAVPVAVVRDPRPGPPAGQDIAVGSGVARGRGAAVAARAAAAGRQAVAAEACADQAAAAARPEDDSPAVPEAAVRRGTGRRSRRDSPHRAVPGRVPTERRELGEPAARRGARLVEGDEPICHRRSSCLLYPSGYPHPHRCGEPRPAATVRRDRRTFCQWFPPGPGGPGNTVIVLHRATPHRGTPHRRR